MTLVNLKRALRLSLVNFWRNRWISLGSILVLSLTLITVTVSVIQNIDIDRTIKSVEDKLDLIVYFDDKVSEQDIQDLQLKLESRADVKTVKYISKEEALAIWQNLPASQKIKELVSPGSNPLPRSLQIKAENPESLGDIAQIFQSPGTKDKIRRVSSSDNQKLIQNLIDRNKLIRQSGIASSLTFVAISLIVILNTFKIIILTRKDEIEIMRLVGASDYFIRAPLIIEAMLTGFIAAVISTGFLLIGVYTDVPIFPLFISRYFGDVSLSVKNWLIAYSPIIFTFQLLAAFLLTVSITFVSMRRYLKK